MVANGAWLILYYWVTPDSNCQNKKSDVLGSGVDTKEFTNY